MNVILLEKMGNLGGIGDQAVHDRCHIGAVVADEHDQRAFWPANVVQRPSLCENSKFSRK